MIKKGNVPLFEYKPNGFGELNLRDIDTKTRTITYVGHTYNYLYHGYEAIAPGSATKSIAENGPKSTGLAKIKHAINHDYSMLPPGKITLLDEREMDIKGQKVNVIYGETKLTDNTPGNDLLMSYLDGVIDNHSIGFQYLDYNFFEKGHGNSEEGKKYKQFKDNLVNPEALGDDADMVCLVSGIRLRDISSVNFGAQDMTPYLGAKSANSESLALKVMNKIQKLEQTVRRGLQSDEMMESFELQILQMKEFMRNLFEDVTLKEMLLNAVNKDVNKNKQNVNTGKVIINNIASDFKLD